MPESTTGLDYLTKEKRRKFPLRKDHVDKKRSGENKKHFLKREEKAETAYQRHKLPRFDEEIGEPELIESPSPFPSAETEPEMLKAELMYELSNEVWNLVNETDKSEENKSRYTIEQIFSTAEVIAVYAKKYPDLDLSRPMRRLMENTQVMFSESFSPIVEDEDVMQ